jgi:hypothetical protein
MPGDAACAPAPTVFPQALLKRGPSLLEIICYVLEIFWRSHYVKTDKRVDEI